MNMYDLLTILTIVSGVVAIIQLLEYIFTKNIPWLTWSVIRVWRWLKRKIGLKKIPLGQRYLVLNFSSHRVSPAQQSVIQKQLAWPSVEPIEAGFEVPEGKNFVAWLESHLDKIDVSQQEWQSAKIVAVPPGFAPAWGVILAALHGRLGYFPDMVRIRSAKSRAEDKFEVAEIVPLLEVRSRARAKR